MVTYSLNTVAKKYDCIHPLIEWLEEELSLQELNVTVDIEITAKALTQYACDGYVEQIELGDESCYDMLINPRQPKKELLKTLIHEFVHVQQMAQGRFKAIGENKMLWQDRIVYPKKYRVYKNIPWEKEAYALEESLYKKYINRCYIKQ